MKDGLENNSKKSSWATFRGRLFIHKKWYKRGLVVVSNTRIEDDEFEDKIQISHARTLNFDLTKNQNDPLLQPNDLGNDLVELDKQSIIYSKKMLSKLLKNSSLSSSQIRAEPGDNIFFTNPKQQTEVFLPIVLKPSECSDVKETGFYVYPWITGDIDSHSPVLLEKNNFESPDILDNFKGIKQFVMASCLFGTALQAIDKKGATFPIIQHKIPFLHGEKIVDLIVDDKLHPYEEAQFDMLDKLSILMKQIAADEHQIKILYHLPGVDYIFYGVKLFLQKRMDFDVLEKFFSAVIERANKHKEIINNICKKNNIIVEFSSPFDNLFDDISYFENVSDVFSLIGLDKNLENFKKENNQSPAKSLEHMVTKNILALLTENTFSEELKQVWSDFLTVSRGKYKITNLESLFKVANAIVIGLAAKNYADCEVCSLLPSNEKPIAVKYAHYQNLINNENTRNYSNVLALTYIEPVIAHSKFAAGNTFYFRPHEQELSTLNNLILDGAYYNLGLFASGKKPKVKLSQLIEIESSNHIFKKT